MTDRPSTLPRREPSGSRASRNPLDLQLRRLRRFLRSPKGYLLLVLAGLTILAAPSTGITSAATVLAAAILSTTLVELLWVRWTEGLWRIPSSALLSGLIIGLVLSAQEPWYVAASAGAIAIAAKHVLRLRSAHIFNPAAVGLLAVFFLFGSGQSWWGAFANLPLAAVIVVLAGGMFVAGRANKLPVSLAFLGAYVSLFTLAAVSGFGADVADVFRSPFVNMAVFFGFMMLTDPPTSPVPFPAQVWFGVGAAVLSFVTYMATHGLYFLLVGVLASNLGYAAFQLAGRTRRHEASRHTATPTLALRQARAAEAAFQQDIPGFDNRVVSMSFIATAGAILLVLIAGVAIFRAGGGDSSGVAPIVESEQSDSGSAGAAAPAHPGASSAPVISSPNPSTPSGLSFQDHFTGTVVQHTDQSGGGTVDIAIAGTGDRQVQLVIKLQISGAGGGRTRVTGNQAVLSDAGGTQLCQGQLTAFDDTGFTVQCQGAGGGGAGTSLAVVATITDGTASQMEGDLQVAPFNG
jgi:Na+-translocating ferredoxin:NAD+ oxidoreductase RnfD subunit